jgi:hypothetical protein
MEPKAAMSAKTRLKLCVLGVPFCSKKVSVSASRRKSSSSLRGVVRSEAMIGIASATFHYNAADLRRLPPLERDAILSAAAALAESEYRRNPERTAFEAFDEVAFSIGDP